MEEFEKLGDPQADLFADRRHKQNAAPDDSPREVPTPMNQSQ